MRAALLESVGRLVLTEVDAPVIEDVDQVLVQVYCVGICGSEVHAFEGTHPYRKAPTILGHELAGVVTDIGDNVTQFKKGDRVIVDPQWTCGECDFCLSGQINRCEEKLVLGTPQWPGAFGEFIIAPEESVFHLPNQLSFVQGAMIEPLTVAVHVARQAQLQAGETVLVLGTGSIGSMVSGVCRALGAGVVITADIHQHCLDNGREKLGATHTFLLPDEEFSTNVFSVTDGKGVDVAFVTGDDPDLVRLGLELVKRGGRVVLVALLTEAPLQIWAYDLIGSEKQLIGSNMATYEDVQQALELTVSGQVDVDGIVTHILPLAEAQRGMELAHSKDDNAIKVILTFSNSLYIETGLTKRGLNLSKPVMCQLSTGSGFVKI